MRKIAFCLLLCGLLLANAYTKSEKINNDWKFRLGDTPEAAAPDFNDSGWEQLSLPHDWSIRSGFDVNTPAGNDGGYLPTGTGWYRKLLTVAPGTLDKKRQLYFEGVYMNSEVYVNGELAGGHPYGYSSFYVDITPYLKEGKNVIAVKADNSQQKNCRWYSGSGIYRNVWLRESNDVHIADWGVRITTPSLHDALIGVELLNESDRERTLNVAMTIGSTTKDTRIILKPGEKKEVEQSFILADAKPWSPDSPNLYTADINVSENGKTLDSMQQDFGFRTIEYSAAKGFLLNGEPLLINGSCVHHDNGILGAAAFDRAEWKRAEQLKEAGFNAVRTSHNPPSEAFLNACDKVGLMVIDEAFDGWRDEKNTYDYHTIFDRDWQKDLDAMILRDRNHPSIICWSIGNEVIERDKIEVVTTAKKLAGRCRELDPTRPVTSALANWGRVWETYDPLAEQHDIVGYNYTIHESEADHQRVPERVMWQTESYPRDAWSNYRKVADHPYIIGDFVWTGMDYIGESGIGRWYYIVIEVVDKDGNVVPLADNALQVMVSGNATLQALGNADIKDTDPYFDNSHKAWKGRALAVVRSNGKKGKAKVKVTSPGLPTASATLTSR